MNILSICSNPDVLSVLRMVKTVITIIKIAVPIILIVSLMIDYTRAMTNSDSSALLKANKTAVSKVIAAMLVFYIPTFVYLIADISSYNKNSIIGCIGGATDAAIAAAHENLAQTYVDIARKELTDAAYSNAVSHLLKVKDESVKKRMLEELQEVKEEIEKKKKEAAEARKKSHPETGWWFPVGGASATTIGGVQFADGAPVSTYLTAYFGGNDSVHRGLGGGHGAIDVGVAQGTYVIAARSGTVVRPTANERIDHPNSYIKPDSNGKYNCRGLVANYVKIDHGDGLASGYAHLYQNTITVRAGDHVEQGQIIGKVGSSGCSTGPHLHFEVFLNGTKVDPLNYVSTSNTRP